MILGTRFIVIEWLHYGNIRGIGYRPYQIFSYSYGLGGLVFAAFLRGILTQQVLAARLLYGIRHAGRCGVHRLLAGILVDPH
ncbi:hypothetical protein D3C76_1605880 [compost metagenome]